MVINIKIVSNEYEIETNKSIKDYNIASFSNLNINQFTKKVFLKELINFLSDKKIDFITITGDNMYSWEYLDKINLNKLEYLLKEFGNLAKVIISLGDHDLSLMNDISLKKFEDLNRFKNVYALNNKQINFNEISFTGFAPNYIQEFKSLDQSTQNFYDNFLKQDFLFKGENLNILLNHYPYEILNLKEENQIDLLTKYIDLILSAYDDDMYIPINIKSRVCDIIKNYNNDLNLKIFYRPLNQKLKIERDLFQIGNAKMIINKGISNYIGYIPPHINLEPNIDIIKIKQIDKQKEII